MRYPGKRPIRRHARSGKNQHPGQSEDLFQGALAGVHMLDAAVRDGGASPIKNAALNQEILSPNGIAKEPKGDRWPHNCQCKLQREPAPRQSSRQSRTHDLCEPPSKANACWSPEEEDPHQALESPKPDNPGVEVLKLYGFNAMHDHLAI